MLSPHPRMWSYTVEKLQNNIDVIGNGANYYVAC
jgi:hypothetical protein